MCVFLVCELGKVKGGITIDVSWLQMGTEIPDLMMRIYIWALRNPHCNGALNRRWYLLIFHNSGLF